MALWVLILTKAGKPIAAIPTRKGKTKKQILKAMANKLKKRFKFKVVTKSVLDKFLVNKGSNMTKKKTRRTTRRKVRRRKPVKRRRVVRRRKK